MIRMLSLAAAVLVCSVPQAGAQTQGTTVEIIRDAKASWMERLAAQEIRRYVYVRTGAVLSIRTAVGKAATTELIVVGNKDRAVITQRVPEGELRGTIDQLAAEQYVVKSVTEGDRKIILLAGGDDVGTLYAAYQFAEQLGVRFYLHGDVIPDQRVPLELGDMDQVGKPLFTTRGIQPFHDFPEGPDWWDADAYKAILAQLAEDADELLRLAHLSGRWCRPGANSLDRSAERHRRRRTGVSQLSVPAFRDEQRDRRLGLSTAEDERLCVRRIPDVRPRRLRARLHARYVPLE